MIKYHGNCCLSVSIELEENTEEQIIKEIAYFKIQVEERLNNIKGVSVQFESQSYEEVNEEEPEIYANENFFTFENLANTLPNFRIAKDICTQTKCENEVYNIKKAKTFSKEVGFNGKALGKITI